jgi:hypothetical protein
MCVVPQFDVVKIIIGAFATDVRSLVVAQLTCKRWREFVLHDEAIWKTVWLSLPAQYQQAQVYGDYRGGGRWSDSLAFCANFL